LERCGWRFFRVRASSFYRNRVSALAPLWGLLEERGTGTGEEEEKARPMVQEMPPVQPPTEGPVPQGTTEIQEPPRRAPARGSNRNNGDESSEYRVQDVTKAQIHSAIIAVRKECPNHSCTTASLLSRVLKHLGILTRGKPRSDFQRRIANALSRLVKQGKVEIYRATNERVRLIEQPSLW
jgi:hypothetical protein